jgi:hypothetical protein
LWAAFFAVPVLIHTAAACLPDLGALARPVDASVPPPLDTCGDELITPSENKDAGESCDPGDADVPGCSRCHVTCEGTLDETSDHCYFAAGSDDSYQAAKQRCIAANAHVVTVGSLEEAALVDGLLAANGEDGGRWVGLERIGSLGAFQAAASTEPGWPIPPATGPCWGCFAIADDSGVFADAVDAATGTLDCVGAMGNVWRRVPCTGAGPLVTICEREPPGLRLESCGGIPCVTVPFTADTKTYLIIQSPTTSDEARDFCKRLGTSLVVFDSRQEREQLARELDKLLRDPGASGLQKTLSFWVGVYRKDGPWQWEDGTLVDDGGRPPPWGNAEPAPAGGSRAYLSLRTAVYDSQLVFADERLDASEPTKRAFVCEQTRRPP